MIDQPKRYHSVAIILHWVMAFGFFLMLATGVMMVYFITDKSLQFQMYQWHKSGGVVLLLAASVRMMWRLSHVAPPLPGHVPTFERWAAKAGHVGLYVMMFLLPITGWVMVSSSIYGLPTIVFGMFEWPHIPNIQGQVGIENLAKQAHLILAIIFAGLIAGHVAAVIKHAVLDHEHLLTRMWWTRNR